MDDRPLVVGVDGSEESRRALQWAVTHGRAVGAPVEAVMAWQVPVAYGVPAVYQGSDFEHHARAELEKTLAAVVGDTATVTPRLVNRHPAEALVDASRGAQLLVVGSRGRGAFLGMVLGSVSRHCVGHAHCPVLVMREPEREPGR